MRYSFATDVLPGNPSAFILLKSEDEGGNSACGDILTAMRNWLNLPVLILAAAAIAGAQDGFGLHEGDRVVF
jgi:hypothetical protein